MLEYYITGKGKSQDVLQSFSVFWRFFLFRRGKGRIPPRIHRLVIDKKRVTGYNILAFSIFRKGLAHADAMWCF
ncbi:MAG TPA: hypothetical protein DDY70_03480 [Clostridiales bacterium]|nr:hypothetical protein [Clostridiales bacterium]